MMKIITSNVTDHEGNCTPIWLNTNQINNITSEGVSGFFRSVKRSWAGFTIKVGNEFHGIIYNGIVESTSINQK